jgi:hypothetical protein
MVISEMAPGGDWMIDYLELPYPGGTWTSMKGLPRRRLLAYMRLLKSNGVDLNTSREMVVHLYRDAIYEWTHRTAKTKKPRTKPRTRKKSGA